MARPSRFFQLTKSCHDDQEASDDDVGTGGLVRPQTPYLAEIHVALIKGSRPCGTVLQKLVGHLMLKRPASDSTLLRSRSGMDLRVQVHPGVDPIAQADWERLFPGDPESWAFYRSGDQAPPPGFTLGAISVQYAGRDRGGGDDVSHRLSLRYVVSGPHAQDRRLALQADAGARQHARHGPGLAADRPLPRRISSRADAATARRGAGRASGRHERYRPSARKCRCWRPRR